MSRINLFSPQDIAAIGLLFFAWMAIGWLIENPPQKSPSVSILMEHYRREWMQVMVSRDPRIFDAPTPSTIRQGAAFFASARMIAIGGALALLGNAERLSGLANDLTLDTTPVFVWEVKLLTVTLFLANAFLKFVWSHRLFGYCAVLIAAVPNDSTDPVAKPRAEKAAEINITAARGFNRGLRSVYFSLGATAWMLGPFALIGATLITFFVLWRREFASRSRAVLMRPEDKPIDTQT